MKEPRIYVPKSDQYMPTRKDLTRLITGFPLLPEGFTATKIMLTKVAPNGEFSSHVDEYHHVFYFISGQGRGHVDNRYYDIVPQTIVEVPAGIVHGYQNLGSEPMQLVSINIPTA
ncbi:MAG: cupin domain-containing protein [Candidatus Thorarchaeota archaeon]